MRQPRLKAPPDWTFAYYHCVSRVVDRRFVIGEEEKLQFIRLMRLYEKFCQVRVLTFCVMSNHFHLLVEVPARPIGGISEDALLRHIAACFGRSRAHLVSEEVRQFRSAGAHEAATAILEGWTSRMWDLSAFMKTLKQRFTQWFNKHHARRGTLWEDRYHSTLVEGGLNALAMVGAYIDLNPVRAALVTDPKDYRWSGYGAAVAGMRQAREGIERLVFHAAPVPPKGAAALARYRVAIYGAADTGDAHTRTLQSQAAPGSNQKGHRPGFDHAEVEYERARAGQLTRLEMLHCRVRYFTSGAVIGSRQFIDQLFVAQRQRFGPSRITGARPMRGADFSGLCTLRDLRRDVIHKET